MSGFRPAFLATVPRWIRYGVIGALSALIDISVTFVLWRLGVHYLAAAIAGFLTSVTLNYLGHAWITFATGHITPASVARYLLLLGANLALTTLLMAGCVEVLRLHALLARAMTIAAVALHGYYWSARWVFKLNVT